VDGKEAVSEDPALFSSHQLHRLTKTKLTWPCLSGNSAKELAWQAETAGEGLGVSKEAQ
jgi:hypothetical protein